MTTAVITGAAGFLAGHLAEALLRHGYDVWGVDRRPTMPAGVLPVVAELLGHDADDALRSADVVFHLAGATGVRHRHRDSELRRRRDNVEATARVTELVPPDVPLIVTSSSSVYGGATAGPCAETDPLRPRGGYARSKVEVEALCAKRLSRGGEVAVARPFTVAGEGQRADMAIALWLAAARNGSPLRVIGSIERSRDVTDARHVAEGLRRMAERNVRATVNLGTGVAVTLKDIIHAVSLATGRPARLDITPATAEEPAHSLADTRRCARLLGFAPATDINELVRRQSDAAALVAS